MPISYVLALIHTKGWVLDKKSSGTTANHVCSCYQPTYLSVAHDPICPFIPLILSAATIQPIHMFSLASSVFFAANTLHPCFWRSCNPGPTFQASVTERSMTLKAIFFNFSWLSFLQSVMCDTYCETWFKKYFQELDYTIHWPYISYI